MNRILLTLGSLLAASSIAMGDDERPAAVRGLIENHCVDCHGPTVQKAKLRLDQLTGDFTDPAVFRTWVKVFDRVKAGEMPPKAKLAPKETAPALAALAERLNAIDQKRQQERGRTVIRRLNRVEFENTLRDLLAATGAIPDPPRRSTCRRFSWRKPVKRSIGPSTLPPPSIPFHPRSIAKSCTPTISMTS
jgi:hypothetical protein